MTDSRLYTINTSDSFSVTQQMSQVCSHRRRLAAAVAAAVVVLVSGGTSCSALRKEVDDESILQEKDNNTGYHTTLLLGVSLRRDFELMEQSNPAMHGHYDMRNMHVNGNGQSLPAPLFERLATEEVNEFKTYSRIIENQSESLARLERVNNDLESRLEDLSREKAELEDTLEMREREWTAKFKQLEESRDLWKREHNRVETEKEILKNKADRKDDDLRRMMSKKYDRRGESPGASQATKRNVIQYVNDRQSVVQAPHADMGGRHHQGGDQMQFSSPLLAIEQRGTSETIRIQNVQTLLSDFFAL
eukprot:Nitzschia sp. Nitz4//scaffold4_size323378//202382//203361//NITZ4_000676-RA/size323378-snap-gene-0.461-mRNA-1//-1//CDS//3329553447//6822//frame0